MPSRLDESRSESGPEDPMRHRGDESRGFPSLEHGWEPEPLHLPLHLPINVPREQGIDHGDDAPSEGASRVIVMPVWLPVP